MLKLPKKRNKNHILDIDPTLYYIWDAYDA